MTHTLTSKRKLVRLVEQGHVRGWDDPRMPTLSGMRRRGYPAAAVRDFGERYERDGDEMMDQGLYADLEAWRFHFLQWEGTVF